MPGSRRTLVVLFIPSVERDGQTPVDQDYWVNQGLMILGEVYGGATAYPRGRGVWRDEERGGTLVFDEPVVVHSYTSPTRARLVPELAKLAAFCRRMGREAKQGEVGLVIADRYYAIREFKEARP